MSTPDSEVFDDFLGEEVVDSSGNVIGSLACYWEQDDTVPVLIGIDIGGSSEATHVAPAKGARLDLRKSYVVLAFDKEKIRRAPCLECGSELDADFEKKVFAFYGDDAFDYELSKSAERQLRRKFNSQ